MTIEKEKSRFYLSESGKLNDMSLEEDKSPKRHLRRLSEFFTAHTKADCSSCSKVQEENDRLERELQAKRAELRLVEVAMNKVKDAYMDACLEIAHLKKELAERRADDERHEDSPTPSSTNTLTNSDTDCSTL